MVKFAKLKLISVVCMAAFIFSSCANTIPSRSKNAIPIHPAVLYPARVAVIAFMDARPDNQKEKAKKISWPKSSGRIDYYSENIGSGLAAHIAEYLTASHVFTHVQNMEFLQSDTALKSFGYQAVLMGKITSFNASFEVPAWVLVLAVAPIPLFGLTLVPIVVWPKTVGFDAVLDDLKLKNLNTGEVYSLDKIEIMEIKKSFLFRMAPKWYLGELAEKVSKKLIQELQQADIRF